MIEVLVVVAIIAILAMLGMLLMMLTGVVSTVTAVLITGMIMIIGGCLNMEEAYRAINMESVVLIAAMLPMSSAAANPPTIALGGTSVVQPLTLA